MRLPTGPLLIAGFLLSCLGLVATASAFFGEAVFYSGLVAGLAASGFGLGLSRGGKKGEGSRLEWYALAGVAVLSPFLGFLVAAYGLRFRTTFLPEFYARFKEDATPWQVLSAFDSTALKAFLTCPLPFFLTLLVCLAGVSMLAGRIYARIPEKTGTSLAWGGLAVAVIFPLVLGRWLNLFQIGALGAGAVLAASLARAEKRERAIAVGAFALCLVVLVLGSKFEDWLDRIVFQDGPRTQTLSRMDSQKTVTLTRSREGQYHSLYVDRFLQFTDDALSAFSPGGVDNATSVLVHGALALHRKPERVLILGGASGVIAREFLKHASVKKVFLVDSDAHYLALARDNEVMKRVNAGALSDPRVRIVVADPYVFTTLAPPGSFDVILKDYPEGTDETLSRSFSREALGDARRLLALGGMLAVHSDYFATPSYWTVVATLRAAGFKYVIPLNDNYSSPDALEGVLLASDTYVYYDRLEEDPMTRYLSEKGVMPSPQKLDHLSKPEYMAYAVRAGKGQVSTLGYPVYLRQLREENGFFLPLVFPTGTY